ncbi:hypothetical protein [Methylomonas rosea]|uniref:Uncharacterized protein n=1 Tax=Methylomonas rosea TaxID=2952227 RepID=A0ABT1TZX8_9GAMM|nr:hypothetical protein [Methylomonas sp. WSC-7]MCQ8120002.1 hypothetical protein [Methylomonas sp. WSC-7]
MTTEQRKQLIAAILSHLRFHAFIEKKFFDEGDTFLSLIFMDDQELSQVATLAGC